VDLLSPRADDPVVYDPALRQWFLFAYDDVRAALADDRLAADPMHRFAQRAPREALDAVRHHAGWLLNTESSQFAWVRPVLHGGLRSVVGDASARAIAAAADELLDELLERDRFDVVGDYALALSGRVLADFLGVDRRDGGRLMGWARDLVAFFDELEVRVAIAERMARSTAAMVAYAHELVADDRDELRGGLLALVAQAAAARGRRLDDEALGNLTLPVLIGQVPVAQLVANTVWLLLEHEDERRRLAADPSLLPSAVSEALRYLPPGPLATRIALERIDLRGHVVQAGQAVQLSLAAANRDPGRFSDPDRFDIARREGGALTFGHGPHTCLGAGLARLQTGAAVRALLARAPELELDPGRDVAWSALPGLLGPQVLGVRVR
jgi:cytochrome P450